MKKPIVFHYTTTANVPYTFNFGVGCSAFQIKNFSNDQVQLSYGDEIDLNSYMLIAPKTAETIYAEAVATVDSETDKVTVQSVGASAIEIRLLEF